MNRRFFTLIAAAVLTLSATTVIGAEPSPLAESRALYEKSCATCHPLERSLAKKADKAGWESKIGRAHV